jgi:hypothetical protein
LPEDFTNYTQALNVHPAAHNDTNAAVNGVIERVDRLPVNVKDHGATGDGTTDDLGAIVAAISAAGTGTPILFPEGTYLISAALAPMEGQRLVGSGIGRTTIVQDTWGPPAFDVLTDGVEISDMTITSAVADRDTDIPGSFRGAATRTYSAGIWSSAHRTRYSRLAIDTFIIGIRLDNWNLDGIAGVTVKAADQTVTDIELTDVDFGVSARGQARPRIRNIRGSYLLQAGSSDPAHLVYFGGTNTNASTDVAVSNCQAIASSGGGAYKFNGVTRGHISGLYAEACPGVLQLVSCNDLSVIGVTSIADTTTTGTYALDMESGGTEIIRVRISDVLLKLSGVGAAMNIRGDDTEVSGFTVFVGAGFATSGHVCRVNGGSRNRYKDGIVHGDAGNGVAFATTAGTGHVIDGVETFNVQQVGSLAAASGTMRYDPELQHSVASVRSVVLTATTNRLSRRGGVATETRTTGGTFNGNASSAETLIFDVQTGAGVTFSARDASAGMALTLIVWNNTAGVLGTITWAAVYQLAAAFVAPTAGLKKTITFRHDGTNFIEVSRSA